MKISSLYVEYSRSSFCLGEVNLEIPEKKITCILGPNGSGKTTLLRALGGLINSKGYVYINGKENKVLDVNLARKTTSYIGYEISVDSLMNIKVFDVLLTTRYRESSSFFENEKDIDSVMRVAKRLGIDNLLFKRIDELSSGEIQKVMIAMAIIKSPKYYLLDEPDAHVDMGFKPELSNIIKSLRKDGTIIMATHDPIFAQLTCDYYVLLSNGKVVFHGEREALLKSINIVSTVFGVKFKKTSIENVGEIILPIYS